MTGDTRPGPKVRTEMDAITYRLTLNAIPFDQDPAGGVRIGRPARSPSLPPLTDEARTESPEGSPIKLTDTPTDEPGPTPPG